ncbi:MAG: hypothetical protein GTO62_19860, partial [Planctomycetales bacterium]|nr:hypothetical protein [Planctomycetales bacterium]
TTNDNGEFWFMGLTPGVYTLSEDVESLPEGYQLTTEPNEREITILSGQEWVWEPDAADGMLLAGQEAIFVDGDPENGVNEDLVWGNGRLEDDIQIMKFINRLEG